MPNQVAQAIKQCTEVAVLLNGYVTHTTKCKGQTPPHGGALNSESCHQDCVVLWSGAASHPRHLLLPVPRGLCPPSSRPDSKSLGMGEVIPFGKELW